MMSGTGGTTRANSRTNKDKATKTQHIHNSKTDGTQSKAQATPEQIRMAQMFNDKSKENEELIQKIKELADLTGKDNDDIAIALHDCENDLNRTYLMLMEGENDQGEWKEPGKKKKRQPNSNQKDSMPNNHTGDSKPERSENFHRGRPDRDGERERDKDNSDFTRNESSNRRGRRDTRPPRLSRGRGRERDHGNDMVWRDNDTENERNREEAGPGGMRERGRGRGRGVNGSGRRGGRGGGRGGETNSTMHSRYVAVLQTTENFRSPRFDKGPQIDTWTNETAENAQKEIIVEDWNDDSWTGSLKETKVFTSKSIPGGPSEMVDQSPPQVMPDTSNGITQNNSLPQRLDLGVLLQKTANDVVVTSSVTESQFISQYNKEATESIKNSIGIGSSNRSNLPPPSSAQAANLNQLASLGSSLSALQQQNRLSGPHSVSPPASVHQRPKPQKSKLPPPSKIPASAVEMPGDMVASLDVQFGNLEFGADTFSFGGSESMPTNTYANNTSSLSGAPGLGNHLDGVSSADQALSAAMRGSTTPSKSTGISALDQTSPRANMYPNSYNTSPTKNEMNSPEPIPFPTSDLKTSPLVSGQRPGQATNSLQGSLASNSVDTSALYGQSAGYQSGYKTSGLNSAQNYTHAASTLSQTAQYPNSLASQASQAQYQAAQSQYPTGTNQYSSYQSPASFQTQTGYPSQSNQSSLYQSATSTGSYQNQSGSSYPSRDTQSGSSFQTNVTQSSASSYPRDSQTSSSYVRDSQPSVTSYQRDSQASASAYQTQQPGPFPRDTQSTAYSRDAQSGSSYSRDSQSAGSYVRDSQSGSYQRDAQGASVVYQRDSQPSSTYQRDPQGTGSYSSRDGTSASSAYQRDSQSAGFHREPSTGSSYSRDTQPASSYHRDSQSAGSAYGRDSQTASATNYQRDSTPSQSAYSQQGYSATNHQSTLQTSPITTAKLESLSKMAVKDHDVDSQVSQHSYDTSATTSTVLTATTSTPTSSLANVVSTCPSIAATTTASVSSAKTNLTSTSTNSKAPLGVPPGVPLLNAQYIMNMNQAGIPPYYSLQQPLYPGFDELQLLQQRGVPLGSYYDMSSFGAPSTMAGRDQTGLGNVPYTGGEGKLNRVDAQSPVPSSSQPQQSQTAHQQQPFINPALHPSYGYYPYASMVPGAGFQYPHTMFMPPVTNTAAAHAGSTASNQYQKAYGSHSYGAGKGYDDLSQTQDFSKAYGVGPSQSKVAGSVSSVSSGSGSATDLAGYGKAHGQVNAFDKQSFHAGTPNSFNLPMPSVSQGGGPMAGNPYHQYLHMMPPHQAHSMMHHSLQQDSSSSGRGTQQAATQQKSAGSKPYGTYWGAN